MTDGENERQSARPAPPTMADAVGRRLAQIGLLWATPWILGALGLAVAVGLFAAWGVLLIVIAGIGSALGLTTGSTATAFWITALALSVLILFRPLRWTARNLLRVERDLDATIDRLAIPTTVDAGTLVARPTTTREQLAALDARLAAPSTVEASSVGEDAPQQPDR